MLLTKRLLRTVGPLVLALTRRLLLDEVGASLPLESVNQRVMRVVRAAVASLMDLSFRAARASGAVALIVGVLTTCVDSSAPTASAPVVAS